MRKDKIMPDDAIEAIPELAKRYPDSIKVGGAMSEIVITMPQVDWGIDSDFKQCQCTCKKCGDIGQFDFLVDDIVWYGVTSDYWKSVGREDGYLCMKCFDELAAEKNIRYTPYTIIFIGRQCSFEFHKFSASHINSSQW